MVILYYKFDLQNNYCYLYIQKDYLRYKMIFKDNKCNLQTYYCYLHVQIFVHRKYNYYLKNGIFML